MAAFRTSAAGGGTSGTSNRTATITPAVGDLFVVFCNASGNTNSAPTCSDNNGGTYSLVGTAAKNSSADMMSCFVRDSLLPNTTSTVVTVATGSNTAAEIVIVAVSGMAKSSSGAVRQSGKQANQAASTTPAPALPASALTVNVTLGAVGNTTTPATMTSPSGWTERQDVGQSTPSTGLEVVSRDSGFTGTTVTWGSTSGSAYASFVVELDGSDSGAAAVTLGSVSSSGAGAVVVSGSAGPVVDDVTLAATGTVTAPSVSGTLSVTLDDATSVASGLVVVSGSSSATITGSVSGTGQVVAGGQANMFLADFSADGTGAVAVAGSLGSALASISGVAEGQVIISGQSFPTQADAAAAATGTVTVTGDADAVVGDTLASASGGVSVSGTTAMALDAVNISATGTSDAPQPITGAASVTLSDVYVQATARARTEQVCSATLSRGGLAISDFAAYNGDTAQLSSTLLWYSAILASGGSEEVTL